MFFVLGYIAGIVTASLIILVLTYFRKQVEHKAEVFTTRLSAAGPAPRGFIIEPIDDADEAREQIIEENQKHGRSTKLSELL